MNDELINEVKRLNNEAGKLKTQAEDIYINGKLENKDELIKNLEGIVSLKTLLSQVPFVADVNKELLQIEEEKKKDFNLFSDDEFSDDDDSDSENNGVEENPRYSTQNCFNPFLSQYKKSVISLYN